MTPASLPVRILATWLGILPVALLAQVVLSPVTGAWPAPWATIATLALAVPVAVTWTVPFALRLAGRWARPVGGRRRGASGAQA